MSSGVRSRLSAAWVAATLSIRAMSSTTTACLRLLASALSRVCRERVMVLQPKASCADTGTLIRTYQPCFLCFRYDASTATGGHLGRTPWESIVLRNRLFSNTSTTCEDLG